MSFPLKVYRSLNYLQLFVSVYGMVWLQKFFVESVQCNMIENRASVTPYMLHYNKYLFPDCSTSGSEWLMGYWDSIILRIILVAWIVISIFIFFHKRCPESSFKYHCILSNNITQINKIIRIHWSHFVRIYNSFSRVTSVR